MKAGLAIIAAIAFFYLLGPVVVIVGSALGKTAYLLFPPQGLTLRWFAAALADPRYLAAFGTSAAIAVATMLAALALGLPASYALARYEFPLRDGIGTLLLMPLILPTLVLSIGLTVLFSHVGFTSGSLRLAVAHLVICTPYVVRVALPVLQRLDPALEEAARSLGANPIVTFLRVTLPAIRPGAIAAATLAFIVSFDELDLAIFLADPRAPTLPVTIYAGYDLLGNSVRHRSDHRRRLGPAGAARRPGDGALPARALAPLFPHLRRTSMSLGTADWHAGRITRGEVTLSHYPVGPATSAVMLGAGRSDGPTLWVQAGIHGPEVVGQLAIARFLRGLDLAQLRGRIACLMVANPFGFRGRDRLTPQDGVNLNRVFPGKSDGTVSEQLAYRLLELALETGDVMLDLHSGGDLTITPFYVIWHKGDGEASLRSQELSRSVGSRLQWGSDEAWLDGAAFTGFTRRGKPALIVESGGGARVQPEDLDNLQTALRGMCQALGMLPGTPPVATDIRYGGNAVHLKARAGGFWHPLVRPGEDVVGGQALGHVVDIWGDEIETTPCCFPQAWIGSIRRPYMPVYPGDQIIELVERV
jgi:ABC-type spermidine/putrescine transport system permease subunit II/predicted deacylase